MLRFDAECRIDFSLSLQLLYFRPTCIGNSSKRIFRVQNKSRIPIRYQEIRLDYQYYCNCHSSFYTFFVYHTAKNEQPVQGC